MKTNLVVICALSALVGVATAQQVNSQNSASTSSNTSVSAGQNGVNANSNTNANVSSQDSVSAPEHQEHAKKSEHNQPAKHENNAKHEKNGSASATSALSSGTTVSAVLAKPLDSRKCKPGDEVVATASQDVKADGKVVVKKGSKLIGHVTEAKSKGEGEANSSLGLMFDHAVLKNGEQVQMNSVVQAIAAARTEPASMDSDMGAMGSGGVASSGGGHSGLLGGVGSTAGAATGAVANVGGGATGSLNSAVGSTANVGNGVSGALNSTTSGVVGMKGLSLASTASNATEGSVITSTGKSVHLDSGTQMMLRVVK